MRSPLLIGTAALAALTLSACSPAGADPIASPKATPAARSAATVTSCGVERTYSVAPQRVLVGAPGVVDTLDALGVADAAVGTALSGIDEGEIARHPNLQQNTEDWTPAKEYLLAARPDLFIANDEQQLTGDGAASRQDLETDGGGLYVLGDYCIDAPAVPTIDTVYRDVTHLGAIFQVPERAAALNGRLRQRVQAAATEADSRGTTAAAVTIADGDVYALTGAGYQAVLDRLGLKNVFADSRSNFAKITRENVRAADPQVIFVVSSDRQANGVAQAKALFPRAAAVASDRVFRQDENAYQSGGVRLVAALEQAARDLAGR